MRKPQARDAESTLGLAAFCFVMACGWLWISYTVVSEFVKSYNASGKLLAATLATTPNLFEMFNEFLAEVMAEILIVGFIPGGRSGIVIGGAVSLALSVLELIAAARWFRRKAGIYKSH